MSEHEWEFATLGGGCFWCLEAVYERLQGVSEALSGYSGGRLAAPDYRSVCEGSTGHAEVVRVAFDPALISYREILEVFFAIHDPTTLDRQGNDVGSQYRSVIFYHSDAQRRDAEAVIDELQKSNQWPAPVVTQLLPAAAFYPAEDYHRHYFDRHPEQAYCQYVVTPKLAKFRRKFAERIKPSR